MAILCALGVDCLVRGYFSVYATLQPEVFTCREPGRFDSCKVWTSSHLRVYPWGGGHPAVLIELHLGRYRISGLLGVAFSVLNFLPGVDFLPRCSKDDSVSYPTYSCCYSWPPFPRLRVRGSVVQCPLASCGVCDMRSLWQMWLPVFPVCVLVGYVKKDVVSNTSIWPDNTTLSSTELPSAASAPGEPVSGAHLSCRHRLSWGRRPAGFPGYLARQLRLLALAVVVGVEYAFPAPPSW